MKIVKNNSNKRNSNAMNNLIAFFFSFFSMATINAQDNSRSVISRSNFIFYGTIVKMNASNIEVATSLPTAIVKIDEIIDAVPPYDEMKGKEITVLLASPQRNKAGDKQVFFTTGWYYGKTLGVKETPNNLFVPEKLDGLQKKILTERINIRNDSLREELKKTILVIQGTVVEADIKVEENPSLESEHDPEFKKAVIEIKEVIKGKVTGRKVEVYYSSSDDVMWYSSPKLTKGMEGIFLLQVRQAPAIYKINGYTLLDKRDVQPIENLNNIKNLIKN